MQRFNESRITHQSRAAQALLGSGDNSAVAPPVPIPNTEVKRCSPDGSTATGRARVGRRQNKTPTGFPVGVLVSGVASPTPTRRGGTPHAVRAHRRGQRRGRFTLLPRSRLARQRINRLPLSWAKLYFSRRHILLQM